MIYYRVPRLGMRIFMLWRTFSTTAVPLFKRKYHFIDLLWVSHRKWWQLPIVGFQLWF